MNHPLDKPVLSALQSRQAHLACGGEWALRFPVEVSPFAVAREDSPKSTAALAAFVQENEEVSLLQAHPPAAPREILAITKRCVQMSAKKIPSHGSAFPIIPLGEADATEMLMLATLTRPGPFRTRTHSMGRFLGIRSGGRLIAMGGERLALDGFTEVSALCTHPDYRGRGYGEALLRAVGQRLLDEGIIPFLHSYADNALAIALYQRVGFQMRAEVAHAMWQRAAQAV